MDLKRLSCDRQLARCLSYCVVPGDISCSVHDLYRSILELSGIGADVRAVCHEVAAVRYRQSVTALEARYRVFIGICISCYIEGYVISELLCSGVR